MLEGEPRERVEQGAGLRHSEKGVLEVVANLPAALEGLPDAERVAVQGSVPPFLAELLLRELGRDESLALLQTLNSRGPLTGRANLLKGSREALLQALKVEGVHAEPGKFSPWAVHLETRVNAFGLRAFQSGHLRAPGRGQPAPGAFSPARAPASRWSTRARARAARASRSRP